jgi:hypothetical protein
MHTIYSTFSTTFAITYCYGWCWCLHDKKLVVLREKLKRQILKMLFFSPLLTTVEVYLKNYIYREPINIIEELNSQIHEALATVSYSYYA